jgi:hypothetical protein
MFGEHGPVPTGNTLQTMSARRNCRALVSRPRVRNELNRVLFPNRERESRRQQMCRRHSRPQPLQDDMAKPCQKPVRERARLQPCQKSRKKIHAAQKAPPIATPLSIVISNGPSPEESAVPQTVEINPAVFFGLPVLKDSRLTTGFLASRFRGDDSVLVCRGRPHPLKLQSTRSQNPDRPNKPHDMLRFPNEIHFAVYYEPGLDTMTRPA